MQPHFGEGAVEFCLRVIKRLGLTLRVDALGDTVIVSGPTWNTTPTHRLVHKRTGVCTYLEGTIQRSTGDVISNDVEATDGEWMQHVGFCSRPPLAQPGQAAAQCVTFNRSDRRVCIASRDLRSAVISGNLDHGESAVYAAGPDGTGQARSLWKKDGSITQYTTDDNTAEGAGVYTRIGPDGYQVVTPFGLLDFNAQTMTLRHPGGAMLVMGVVTGLPDPLGGSKSFIRLQADIVEVAGALTKLGAGDAHLPAAVQPSPTPTFAAGSTSVLVAP